MFERFDDIAGTPQVAPDDLVEIGRSRERRSIRALRVGSGPFRISLIGGSHADEPVGPWLLRRLCRYLRGLPANDPLLAAYEWWILPHVNPDGEERNRAWADEKVVGFNVADYLACATRELPGDDIEFGYPRDVDDRGARPENRAAWEWWREGGAPFQLHVSLHGMGFAAGPWHLIEGAWRDRCGLVMDRCRDMTRRLGYDLHDVERQGEKGFERIARGFCTRPDSARMRSHFLALGDPDMASRFRPSSMEAIRSLGGDPLTLVSEMPLFLTPCVGQRLGPPDPALEAWRSRVENWRRRLDEDEDRAVVFSEAAEAGMSAMPIRHQLELQWRLITAGIEQVERQIRC